jgi:hypothetical protein
MLNRPFDRNIVETPLIDSPFFQIDMEGGFPPSGTFFMITEDGDFIITEDGDFMITE